MSGKRTYEDGCGMAQGLNLVGERWALMVVRELLLGPKRFSDLRGDLPGVSANVLSQRLDELEASRIVRRRQLDPPTKAWVYELTPWGAELEPVIKGLGRWAARSPSFPRGLPLSVNSVVLSMRTMYDGSAGEGMTLSLQLTLDGYPFAVHVDDGNFSIEIGRATSPDADIVTDQNSLAMLLYDNRDIGEAIASGDLTLTGDRAAFERFVTLFTLPDRVEAPS
jgi:DNA-binding HxlR family transcriptional regulator/putative sterol carrier protein